MTTVEQHRKVGAFGIKAISENAAVQTLKQSTLLGCITKLILYQMSIISKIHVLATSHITLQLLLNNSCNFKVF